MNAWEETLAENESQAREQLEEPCSGCAVRLGDHYTAAGLWVPCELVGCGLQPDGAS